VITAHGEVVALSVGVVAAFEVAHRTPVDCGRIAVLLVAGYDAALATDALRHVKVEAVLFAGCKRACRNPVILVAGYKLIELCGISHRSQTIPSGASMRNCKSNCRLGIGSAGSLTKGSGQGSRAFSIKSALSRKEEG